MAPQQKLVRLAEIEEETRRAAAIYDAVTSTPDDREKADLRIGALLDEHRNLLADVHLPPPELMNLPNDPGAWAKHMAATVAGVTEETALAWLERAMWASSEWAHTQGRIDGTQAAAVQATEGRRVLVDAIRLVLDLIERRQIRPPMVRDANDPDNPAMPLAEYLQGVLRAAGEEA